MIFFGKGLVWDKEKNKLLCSFLDGKYQTREIREIEILKELKYEYEIENGYSKGVKK